MKPTGFLGFRGVWIEGLNRLFSELRLLTGELIDSRSFNAYIDQQKIGDLRVVDQIEKGEVRCVRGFSMVCQRYLPCTVVFKTGLRYKQYPEIEIIVLLKLSRRVCRRGVECYSFYATYDFCGEINGELVPKPRPIPLITNLTEASRLLSYIFGGKTVSRKEEILEQLKSKECEEPVFLSFQSKIGAETIELSLLQETGGKVRIDCTPLFMHLRCPMPYQCFPVDALYDEQLLSVLAEMTRQVNDSPCKWEDCSGNPNHHKYWSLGDYLFELLTRLGDDQKEKEEQKCQCADALIFYEGHLCFCTGLTGKKSGNYIYGVCSKKDETGRYQQIEWVENDYKNGRDARLPPASRNENHGLPLPANWTREPARLVCQYDKLGKLEDRINFYHILNDHAERLPQRFFLRNVKTGEMELNKRLAEGAIKAAIPVARKRVQANYRYAIPGYYHGRIMLQLPLCLDDSEEPNAYLVLLENKEGMYFVPTLLSVAMAYRASRVIIPEESAALEKSLFSQMQFERTM